ncbi:MAG: KpsF/GutQ family sugar-phosphate isomerase [Planctomycetes bacterium]|nr:KpsF/GutQ family sugar-phosphate isomerase [Planctomycetota bacterium]NUQ35743.1 KpsF/GutQ family sugar-phosphate isomerase [Planctomycetaceae bacterium]
MSSIEFGRQVIRAEVDALVNLAKLLDANFDKAVEMILACKGNVVITGVGKPWLVGQKISATMASTGTPSISLHPTEAAHGDLGRIRESDIVIAMSNSGSSEEVVRLLPIVKRIGAPIIGITGNLQSDLARHSDVVLNLGKVDEACPLKLAPSASTTTMMALGDALALAVMERRGFAKEDYALYHPGGALGRSLMKIEDLMRPLDKTAVVKQSAPVKEALRTMNDQASGLACVVDDKGMLLGVFSEGDLKRLLIKDDARIGKTIGDVMTTPGIRLKPGTLSGEALHIIETKRRAEFPVVDDKGKLLGHLQLKDLVKASIV